MSIQTFNLTPSGRQVNAAGTFFRYESAGAEGPDQTIRVRADGNDLGTYLPGDSIELPYTASTWDIVPTQCSAVIKVGMGRITTVRSTVVGSISISNTAPRQVTPTQAQRTVTNVSAAMLGANAARAYLMIQNKDGAGAIWVTFGAAATQANGFRIGPGSAWEWDSTIPLGQVFAIGDLATQSNIVTIEG